MKLSEEQLLAYSFHEASISRKELRKRLMDTDPHCYYCKCVVKEYPFIRKYGLKKRQGFPKDMATIEHLYDRFDERRYRIYKNHENKVLACYRCNYKRSQRRVNSMSKEALAERQRLGNLRKQGNYPPRPILFAKFRVLEQPKK